MGQHTAVALNIAITHYLVLLTFDLFQFLKWGGGRGHSHSRVPDSEDMGLSLWEHDTE